MSRGGIGVDRGGTAAFVHLSCLKFIKMVVVRLDMDITPPPPRAGGGL